MKYLLIIFSLLFMSCQKLPNATQRGNNTFGMFIDKEIFVNNELSVLGLNSVNIICDTLNEEFLISSFNDKYNFTMCVKQIADTRFEVVENVNFQFMSQFNDTTKLWLKNIDDSNEIYRLNKNASAVINISKFDLKNSIISGTFELSLININSKIKLLKQGIFDCDKIRKI